MNTKAMRAALKTAYTGKRRSTWARRVDKMSDEQVVAIYMRLQQQSKV